MSWEHFEVTKSGSCQLFDTHHGTILPANYQRGTISTGKSRVFWGYQISVNVAQQSFVGKSKGYSDTYSHALKDLNEQLFESGLKLLVAGNHDTYSESAMSCGSGYGYIEGHHQAVDIMSFCDNHGSHGEMTHQEIMP